MTSKNNRPDDDAHSTSSLRPGSVQAGQAHSTDSTGSPQASSEQTGQALRRRAEEIVREKAAQASLAGESQGSQESPESIKAQSPEQTHRMLHELRVHQIELEMQNEELRRAQVELEAMRARYFDLYDLAPVGYFTLNETGLILEANLFAAELLGTARNALVNKPLTGVIFPEDQDIYYKNRIHLFEKCAPQECELRLVKKDGSRFWARLVSTAMQNADGMPVCRTMVSDITSQKRAEEERMNFERQLQRSQKIESLGVLAAGIAHDFNNLLQGVFGYIELANRDSKDGRITGYLSEALDTIDRARGLTRQILTFAKGGAPVRKISPLFPFVQETVQFALSGSTVASHFMVQENLWICYIDKNQIAQAINNIIINAQQAMPHGGTIEIAAANITLSDKEHPPLTKGNYVKLSITDSGCGIPKEIVGHIFDPFFTTKEMGHGIGLTTSHSIVNRHGGCIDTESEPGKGSTFHIYLPASTEPVSSPAQEMPISHTKHTGSGTFIVMDDEKIIRDTIKYMLGAFGYSVVCTKNGKEACSAVIEETKANHAIAGMIFDLTVPGDMGGKEAVAEVRKFDTEVPVFVMSGYDDDPVMADPCKYGFAASICKPFRMAELAKILEKNMREKTC
jgi:two-component system cell cycle sensor histidine kinase/response regulator CckA